ncbi:unnamed protein product, partial [Prunus brigantina]
MKQMEGKAMRQWCYLLVLFLALAFGLNICSGLPVMTKRFVRIVNLLDNKQLVYHCHSKDDDLGQRTLAPQQEWEFKFHLDFETIFTCDFWHSNNHHAHFDVFYPSNKFVHRCGGAHCIWRAEEIGLSLYHIKTGSRLQMQEANEGKSNEAVVLFCALPFFGIWPKKLLWLLAWEKALCVGEFIAYGERKRVESTYFTSRLKSGRKCMTGEQEHEDDDDDDGENILYLVGLLSAETLDMYVFILSYLKKL